MTRFTIVSGALTAIFVVLGVGIRVRGPEQRIDNTATTPPAGASSIAEPHEGLLYGRVTTTAGDVYEGRLRFGGDEEALWGNFFNGFKAENPWADQAPLELLPRERLSWTILGIEFDVRPKLDLGRPFMARFGDIARVWARGRDLRVTLKSGTVFYLDRYAADDFADGVRVWDLTRGVVNLGERQIRSIEFLASAQRGLGAHPLFGTVRTRHGQFTGLVQWDREACVGADQLHGHAGDEEVSLRFDSIRSIARRSGEGALITLLDGREIVLSDARKDGRDNRGMYVDDPRYGRVLVSWNVFERIDFSAGDATPAYDDFEPGHPITGTVVTLAGKNLTGRLVYDLDESETTETLDAPWQGVDYMIPLGKIATIEPLRQDSNARVRLQSGEQMYLEPAGDLGESNAGILIFSDLHHPPEYVRWTDVKRIILDRASDAYPSGGPPAK